MNHLPKRFLFIGNSTYLNKGNEAIVRGTVEILRRSFPDAKFILSSFGEENQLKDDAQSETDPGIEHRIQRQLMRRFSWYWWKYRVLLRKFPDMGNDFMFNVQLASDCAFEIGGDNHSLDYGIPKKFINMDQCILSAGTPLVLWGASIGPFSKIPEFENLMKQHLKRFSLICARESETVDYLASIGVTENVKAVSDPAFVMAFEKPVLSENLIRLLSQQPIGINFSSLAGMYRNKDSQTEWHDLAKNCIKSLLDAELGPVILVPHVFIPSQNDYCFMYDIAKDFPEWGETLDILPPNLKAEEYKWAISKLRLFAGARTHATIASLSTCTPTLSLGYSMKARGINKDIFGHLDWLLPMTRITPGLFAEKIKELLECEGQVRRELETVIPDIKKKAFKAADYLEEIL